MTDTFPDVNSKQMIKVLEKLGFEFARQSGSSHAIYRNNASGKRTTVPMHSKKSLKRKTIKAICKDIGMTTTELHNYI